MTGSHLRRLVRPPVLRAVAVGILLLLTVTGALAASAAGRVGRDAVRSRTAVTGTAAMASSPQTRVRPAAVRRSAQPASTRSVHVAAGDAVTVRTARPASAPGPLWAGPLPALRGPPAAYVVVLPATPDHRYVSAPLGSGAARAPPASV